MYKYRVMYMKWKDIKNYESFDNVVGRAVLHIEGDYKKLGIWIRRVFVLDETTLYAYKNKRGDGSLNGWYIDGSQVHAEYGNDGRNILNISIPNVYRLSLSLDSIYEQARLAKALYNSGAKIVCQKTSMLLKTLYNKESPIYKLKEFKLASKLSARMMDVHWTFEEMNAAEKDFVATESSSDSHISQFECIPRGSPTNNSSLEENFIAQNEYSSLLSLPTVRNDIQICDFADREKSISQPELNVWNIPSKNKLDSVKDILNYQKKYKNEDKNSCNLSFRYDSKCSSHPVEIPEQKVDSNIASFPEREIQKQNTYLCDVRPRGNLNTLAIHSGYLDTCLNLHAEPKRSYVELANGTLFIDESSDCCKETILSLKNVSRTLSSSNSSIIILKNKKEIVLVMKTQSAKEADIWREKINLEIEIINRNSEPSDVLPCHKRLARYQYLSLDQIEHRTKELMKNLTETSEIPLKCYRDSNLKRENDHNRNYLKSDNILKQKEQITSKMSYKLVDKKVDNFKSPMDKCYEANNLQNMIGTNLISSDVTANSKNLCKQNNISAGMVKKLANKYEAINDDSGETSNIASYFMTHTRRRCLPNNKLRVKVNESHNVRVKLYHKTAIKMVNQTRNCVVTISSTINDTKFENKHENYIPSNANKNQHLKKIDSYVYKSKEGKNCFIKLVDKSKVKMEYEALKETSTIENFSVAHLRNKFEQICLPCNENE